MVRHGKWHGDFYASSYTCNNRQLPGYCEAMGAHIGLRCGVRHHGLAEGEGCHAVLVLCSFHAHRLHRDEMQEARITDGVWYPGESDSSYGLLS